MNQTSKMLQSENIDLSTAVALMKSLSAFLASQRQKFEEYCIAAKTMSNMESFETIHLKLVVHVDQSEWLMMARRHKLL